MKAGKTEYCFRSRGKKAWNSSNGVWGFSVVNQPLYQSKLIRPPSSSSGGLEGLNIVSEVVLS